MHEKLNTPPAGGQTQLVETGKTGTPLPDDTDALLDVARQAAAAELVPPALIDKLSICRAIGKGAEVQTHLAEALAAGPAAERALDAIAPAFAPGDVIELRALDPAGGGSHSICGQLHNPEKRKALEEFIRRHNGRRNLYLGVNPRRSELAGTNHAASSADVSARRAMVLDFDRKDAPSVDPDWTRTRDAIAANLNPLFIMDSGNGLHVWLELESVSGPDVIASVGPLAAAMARLGADNMADAARIARLPYTVNLPTGTKLKRGAVARLATPLPQANVKHAPAPSVKALCASLSGLATRLGLPGKVERQAVKPAAKSSNYYGPSGERKTATPAPSLEALQLLAEELPNDPGGPFDDRVEWAIAGLAFFGAASAAGLKTEGRDIFLGWSGKWGGDPVEDAKFWDTCRDTHTGWGTLMRLLLRYNPAGVGKVRGAIARAVFAAAPLTVEDQRQIASLSQWAWLCANNNSAPSANRNVSNLKVFILNPTKAPSPSKIPPRRWVYGHSVIAGFVSVLAAPGGTGKSALILTEALAMATGKTLLGGDDPRRPRRVWMHNAEDPSDEQLRRLAAMQAHRGISDAEIGGRLFLTSGRDLSLCLARQGVDGPEIVAEHLDAVVNAMLDAKVDVLILDPLGAVHSLPENDNTAFNVLLGALREIAERTGAAIILVHHVSKAAGADMSAAGADAVRGASAIKDGARIVRQLVRMSEKEARQFGIADEERHQYVRIENGKSNLAPAAKARWMRLSSVKLNNGTPEYPSGDTVAVVEDWTPPGPVKGTPSDLHRVQAAIDGTSTPPRASAQAHGWVGYIVADTLGLDVGKPGTKAADRTPEQARTFRGVSDMVAGWLADGGLRMDTERDPASGRTVDVVRSGTPAVFRDGALQEAVA
ncbi:helicase RepA family protein [Ruegeria sp. 1NDH52C]|uniref:Helicase RepA family protein n=1 Tax=Ruegeria alba TaxID=2916756 RepID=A0ABS9NRR4_9RHOB|nr:AAA family ATPase [Ruegeria alba]MCG6556913.1 helicase RepA family protein [Ruegeria alba]